MNEPQCVNRGFMVVRPKQAYIEWANQFDDEFKLDAEALNEIEPTVYLIEEEEFFDTEPILKKHFKKIFLSELEAACEEDEAEFPDIKLEVFNEWFSVEFGTIVLDTLDSQLTKE